jgi:chaperonin cofactor prefoldin
MDEIERLHQEDSDNESDDEPRVNQALRSRQERLEAEKEILKAHNQKLNEQLERLRRLMQAHVRIARWS